MNEESNKESLDVLKQEPICYLEKEADWTLKKYSLEQIENWSNSKRIIIYSDDEQLKHFIEECLIDKTYSKNYISVLYRMYWRTKYMKDFILISIILIVRLVGMK